MAERLCRANKDSHPGGIDYTPLLVRKIDTLTAKKGSVVLELVWVMLLHPPQKTPEKYGAVLNGLFDISSDGVPLE